MILKADAVPYGSQLSEEMKAEVARLVEQAQYEGVQLTALVLGRQRDCASETSCHVDVSRSGNT